MTKRRFFLPALAVGLSLLVAGCQDQTTSPDELIADAPSFTKSGGFDEAAVARVVEQVDDFNASLEAAGQSIRLDYPWLFVVGPGTDPFGALRTGSRWPITSPGYILDESDYTTDVPFAEVDAALVAAYDSWNDITSTFIEAVREADDGGNFDVLDGHFRGRNCVSLFDLRSPNLDFRNGLIFPESDIVVGGWVKPNYFLQCLGSADIIGVTWTFSDVDMNGDNYRDRLYVEQFYNPAFAWTTTDAVYLDFGAPIDIETIAAHENGHAHGLGHFGGPIGDHQPFTLKPNLRVFNPEAVMNPFYLGGEERTPLSTDVAGFETLYARGQ